MNGKNITTENECCGISAAMYLAASKIKIEEVENDNGQFSQLKNTPNPFNEATVISFMLTHFSDVKIAIYDLTGNKMFDLMNEKMEAGKQTVLLYKYSNIGHLAAGNYLYELTVENENGIFKQCKILHVL